VIASAWPVGGGEHLHCDTCRRLRDPVARIARDHGGAAMNGPAAPGPARLQPDGDRGKTSSPRSTISA